MKDIDTKRPRRLDLNAPLISTRRLSITPPPKIKISRTGSICDGSCDRVPFSWEQSPGKPKDAMRAIESFVKDRILPLPKPPPIRWQGHDKPMLTYDDSFEGDDPVDDDDDDNDNEYDNDGDHDDASFSDAIDLFSLAESLNTSERLDLESDMSRNTGSLSPNFMIQRFLPAATALAASSLSSLASNEDVNYTTSSYNNKPFMGVHTSNNNDYREGSCVPRVAREAYSSSKGCGLEMLFPWRAKHRLCGVSSPVRRVRSSLKPELSPRNK